MSTAMLLEILLGILLTFSAVVTAAVLWPHPPHPPRLRGPRRPTVLPTPPPVDRREPPGRGRPVSPRG
ncbi:hypothetical protein FHS43_004759 [Streptosporangium becharense]|uniref:Uncharacterized protein n=1 Tax=Streptosporangium becharense TaxID=1816182 RepID=A0A7W9II36_9ACTN|nr:hypothetical protein [Streptosporangium becharense]MBB2913455.1 hypothetical protein [Streptosporangium becharense]MBB5821145.1 hypothetical protein [Streptosporangium becharense]